ncbi:putative methyltransferase PMT18 [Prunus yedoensis var. nudiflora]|uniref:Putative methyltransferase PMT18 n=1 Tax=Prunus yedoensis var. nudiflora TaxID=2094558 RepID=A0A314Y0E0_PRUYE|nr:putative methyltransferase PMT18 [Prunus yedoensis var. nudiflora]
MARDYTGGSPKHHHLESKKKRLTWIFGVSALCVVCYMLGAWQTTPSPVNRSELYQRVAIIKWISTNPRQSKSSQHATWPTVNTLPAKILKGEEI